MKPIAATLTGAALLAGLAASANLHAEAATSKAYYTNAQAAAGGKAYQTSCSRCHGANLEGVSGPALRGPGMKGSQSVGDLYAFMSQQMPAGAPGSLSASTYTAIMAFMLKQNGHPSGSTALTPASAKAIKEKI